MVKRYTLIAVLMIAAFLVAVLGNSFQGEAKDTMSEDTKEEMSANTKEKLEVATFAGGCFWCMEGPFDELDGVHSTVSGYTDGHLDDPNYDQVSSGMTGHTEAVQVIYDPAKVSYDQLLTVFWQNIDPTVVNRQFCDIGTQYRTSIFYHNDTQKKLAQNSKTAVEQSKSFSEKIVVPIVEATVFYEAEEYHQDFYKKNPIRYKLYRGGCGRDKRLKELWG